MSASRLRASLRLWEARLRYRRARHAFYHDRSRRPRAQRTRLARKWHRLVLEAEALVHRRRRQIVSVDRRNRKAAAAARGVGSFDGVPVALWMVPYLRWARAHGWQGRLVSGWRDPHYSQSLCFRMCGAPSCPGRCAGLASNHVGSAKPRGAVDVSDYYRFGQLMRRCPYEPRIFNALGARDPVHFSSSGQ